MNYAEGAHDSPADTKDRLLRVGSKYQASTPSVADGDNVYLLVDDAGRPLSKLVGISETGAPIAIADGLPVNAWFTERGAQMVAIGEIGSGSSADVGALGDGSSHVSGVNLFTSSRAILLAPDAAGDQQRGASSSGPGLGAANVAPIGGDISIRASAVAGEASGTSTAVDDLGWVKNFHAVIDVTAVPSGGTPTLDLYLQTQLADVTWQDLAHSAQVAGSIVKQIIAWKGPGATEAGTQAEAAAVTVDNHFANEDAALAASTVRQLPLGDSMRVKWVFAAGGSTGDYTFSVDIAAHS